MTKGKWKWKQTRGNNIYEHTVYAGTEVIAQLDCPDYVNESGRYDIAENIKANAIAIACLPDLIEALEAFLTDAKADKLPSAKSPIRLETILKARQALAKSGVEV